MSNWSLVRWPSAAVVVNPGAARLLDLVHGLVDEEDGAGEPGRGDDRLLEEDHRVIESGLGDPLAAVVEEELVVEIHDREAAIPLGRGLADMPDGGDPAGTREVIPDDLEPVGGNG